MTKIRQIWLYVSMALLVLSICGFTLCNISTQRIVNAADANPSGQTTTATSGTYQPMVNADDCIGSFTMGSDWAQGSVAPYATSGIGGGRLTYTGTKDINYLKAVVRFSGLNSDLYTCNWSLGIKTNDNHSLWMQYFPIQGRALIQEGAWDNWTTTHDESETNAAPCTGDWQTFEYHFSATKLAVCIDGKVVTAVEGDFSATDFANAEYIFWTWGQIDEVMSASCGKILEGTVDTTSTFSMGSDWAQGSVAPYATSGIGGGRLTYTGVNDFNYFETNIRFSGLNSDLYTCNWTLWIKTNDNHSLWMQYYPIQGKVQIQDGSWDNWNSPLTESAANAAPCTGDWQTIKYWFGAKTLAIEIDGNLVAIVEGDFSSTDFANAEYIFWTWGQIDEVMSIKKGNINAPQNDMPVDPIKPSGEWSKNEVDGETQYTCGFNGGRLTYNLPVETNSIQADVKIENVTGSYDTCNFAFYIDGGEKTSFYLPYYSYHGKFTLRSGPAFEDWTTTLKSTAEKSTPLSDGWMKFKFVFTKECVAVYVDGEVAAYAFGNFDTDFANSKLFFWSWGQTTHVKNIEAVDTDLTELEMLDLDMEFSKPRSIKRFTAENGTIEYVDGQMKLVYEAAPSTLALAKLNEPAGDKYAAYLPVTNTLLVRMKNQTSAKKVKVNFITSESGTYDENKSAEFDILPDSDYTTYYFNLSYAKVCTGYLRGFKFTFDDATGGEIYIDAITFEREDANREYAGSITSCLADKNTRKVTVKGTADEKYNGKTVTLYESFVNNYDDSLTYVYKGQDGSIKMPVLGTATVQNGEFEIVFDLENGSMSRLSSKLLAGVEGVRVSKSFAIENYYDFGENPYDFDLPSLTVKVTDEPFNAKGDGFTNDNAAIQAAIDYVNAQGGGTVILSGDTSAYGRRYVATNIKMKSNVELRIESGAILLQSRRASDYDYEVVYGHDKDIEGIVWCHVGAVLNYPLVQVSDAKNIKITGGGTIRMMEAGAECIDGYNYEWNSNIVVGCANTIHVHPIAIDKCENVIVKDITILRANIWNMPTRFTKNIYFANIDIKEEECINGDGFGFTACKNAIVDRCFVYANDDAVTLSPQYIDNRGKVWWSSQPGEDNCVDNITIRHSNLWGGLGIVFIPWGTADPDLENQEIKNITVTDCILGGTTRAVGSWPDNPFYGSSSYYNYDLDNGEKDDFSPVRDVKIYNNVYRCDARYSEIYCSVGCMIMTNVASDCGLTSSTDFMNPSFERDFRYDGEKDWVSGLTWWSRTLGANGKVGYESKGVTKSKLAKYSESKQHYDVVDYAAYIEGEGELFQGLYCVYGAYKFNLDVKLLGGSAQLFARNAETGEILSTADVKAGSEFETYTLKFNVEETTTVQLGLKHTGEDGTKVYLDDATLGIDEDSNAYVVEGTEYSYDFTEDYKEFTTYTTSAAKAEIKDGKLVFESTGEVKYMWNNVNPLSTFEVTMNVVLKSNMNVGLYLFATNVSPEPDNINAYNVQFERDVNGNYKVSLYRFNGKYGGCATTKNVEVSGSDYTIKVVALKSTILVFVNDETKPLFAYEVEENLTGNIGIRSQYQASEINSLKIISGEAQLAAGDSSNLNTLIETAKTYKEYDYTEATYSVLKAALEEAEKAVGLTQYKIDKAYENLYNALMSLERLPAGDKTQLNALIATAKGVDQSKYTADSYAALKNALKVAEDLDENATQGAIDEAYKALDEAYKALEEKPTDPDTDSSTDSGNTSDSGTSSDSGNKGGKKGCKGGIETTSVMLFILGMVAVYAIVKRRRVNE